MTPADRLLKPIHRFIHMEFTGGIVLFASVLAALIWANSPWSHSYYALWETHFSVDLAGYALNKPLHTWINDGLMALFFFVIGLELKREFMAGELSTAKKAALPMIAALGGMLVPAAIFLLFNGGKDSSNGWGIPMATDIAFALALLSLAGKHIPASVKIFLSALAVADDLGAVLVIAFFYTSQIAFVPLLTAGAILLVIAIGNRSGIRSPFFYLILGIAVWIGFLLSGVHATIAGVLVAFLIPARTKIDEVEFSQSVKEELKAFDEQIPLNSTLTTIEQHHNIQEIKKLSLDAETPLQKIEEKLHPWVAFVIMPLFALSNSGIIIGGDFFQSLSNPVSLGIITGLVAGKFIGVFSFTWLVVKMKLAELPQFVSWKHIAGVSLLAGVGFTMSLFVADLAFDNPLQTAQSKYGILCASLLSGLVGVIYLGRLKYRK